MRVGIVLGGGGVTGVAYHAGALAALENDVRWDPRTADVIVGTSAGALIAAILRSGVPAHDLSRVATGSEPEWMPKPMAANLVEIRDELPPLRVTDFVRFPRLPPRSQVQSLMMDRSALTPTRVMTAFLPDGQIDVVRHMAAIADELGDEWPQTPTWLVATRLDDLARVVFGRDEVAPLHRAVAASAAVPGYFAPVTVGERRFVDGGVSSPTNADLLVGSGLELVIVISPLGGRHLSRLGLHVAARRLAAARLTKEVDLLRASGADVIVIEPSGELIKTLGPDFMDKTNIEAIARESFFDTGAQLAAVRPTLTTLAT